MSESVEQAAPPIFWHYVCSECGNYWRAYCSKACPACSATHPAAFLLEAGAREHAAWVASGRG